MWYPIRELKIGRQVFFCSFNTLIGLSITSVTQLVYTIVVVPVSVCRMGVLAGWQPPFGLLVFAGICFAGSGTLENVGIYTLLPESIVFFRSQQCDLVHYHPT